VREGQRTRSGLTDSPCGVGIAVVQTDRIQTDPPRVTVTAVGSETRKDGWGLMPRTLRPQLRPSRGSDERPINVGDRWPRSARSRPAGKGVSDPVGVVVAWAPPLNSPLADGDRGQLHACDEQAERGRGEWFHQPWDPVLNVVEQGHGNRITCGVDV
jgi:hypothetical protein